MAPSGLVRSALRRLRDLVRKLTPQPSPTEEELQREEVIVIRDETAVSEQKAHAISSSRVRSDDEIHLANHGKTADRLQRRKEALAKARAALAEIEENL